MRPPLPPLSRLAIAALRVPLRETGARGLVLDGPPSVPTQAKRDADAERKRRREEARRNRDKLEQTVDLDKQRLAVSSFLEQHRAEGGDEFGE